MNYSNYLTLASLASLQHLAMGILLPALKVSFGHSGSKHVQNRLSSSGHTIYMLSLYAT